MENKQKYKFEWDKTVGADLGKARPNLGPNTRIEVYRLFQFTLMDVLEQHYGAEMTDTLFFETGVMAGKAFYDKLLSEIKDVSSFISKIQELFNTLGMGIFRVEHAAEDNSHFIFTVDEDLYCSGLPDDNDVICVYDEGFIKGVLEAFSGKIFNVREIDCWRTNARTCRFEAKAV
ncbi:MAG: 4-vinyl reductase [Treponema sp.]|jgi:predicted hydrocarbon binding protein|nr:4-vinyl reductase [Treponema sp.]